MEDVNVTRVDALDDGLRKLAAYVESDWICSLDIAPFGNAGLFFPGREEIHLSPAEIRAVFELFQTALKIVSCETEASND